MEHSYTSYMPILKAENTVIVDDVNDALMPMVPAYPELGLEQNLDDDLMQQSSSSNKRKSAVMNEPDSDNSLEDEDLRFKGYCYTTSGFDKTKSLSDLSYACLYCPSVFDSRIGLTNHTKLHGAVKDMTCELCDFSCTNKKTMRVHRRFHGIIPVRGRRVGSGRKQQQKSPVKKQPQKQKTIKVESLDLDEDEQEEETTQKKVDQVMEGEERAKIRRSNRRRITKSNNLNPTAGEVAIEADNAEDEANESEDAQSVDESSNNRVIITTDEDDATIDVVNVKMEERGKRRSARVKAVGQQEKAQTSPDKSANTSPKGRKQGRQQKQNQDHEYQRNSPSESASAPYHELGCVICPYRTNLLSSLDQHMLGHSRQSGYVCSVCNFKHDYKRWLQVHCMLHKDEGIDYQWPPEFVKEGESAADSQTKTVVIGQLKRGSAASSSANRR